MIHLKKHPKKLFFVVLLSGVVFSVFASPVFGSISGAIYTSVEDGGRVNANIYENKEDVYQFKLEKNPLAREFEISIRGIFFKNDSRSLRKEMPM